jgi:PadR family transcriptional regulator AphA
VEGIQRLLRSSRKSGLPQTFDIETRAPSSGPVDAEVVGDPDSLPELSVTDWAVLALLSEKPAHGFAVAKLLAPEADLGRIWTVSRPLVYRALATLERKNLVEPVGVESGDRGPARTRMRATAAGDEAVTEWLRTPVQHVRDLRSQLLLKLRLLYRRSSDPAPLATAQLARLTPILAALQDQAAATAGFDRLLATWRYETALAASHVLEGILRDPVLWPPPEQ